jgi:hypothetical protein
MNEAAEIDDGEPLAFELTGGEPFIEFDRLVEMVAHGGKLGATISCVTNAFWAVDEERTQAKVRVLHDSGLTALGVSVSRFHQQFVPLQRAERTLRIATAAGIRTTLKGAVIRSDLEPGGVLAQWKETLDAQRIHVFPVLPHLRESAVLPEEEYYRERGLPMQRCPADAVCVNFDGVARSCCVLGEDDPFLVIGDAHKVPLRQIRATLEQAGKQRILRESGPIEFARGAIAAGLGHRLRKGYAGPCDLCLHIQSDPQLRQVAEEMASAADRESGR